MANVSMFDIISLALVLILGIKGIINGFVKEVFGLLGIIGGIYFASRYAPVAGKMISDHIFAFGNQASLYLFWIHRCFNCRMGYLYFFRLFNCTSIKSEWS